MRHPLLIAFVVTCAACQGCEGENVTAFVSAFTPAPDGDFDGDFGEGEGEPGDTVDRPALFEESGALFAAVTAVSGVERIDRALHEAKRESSAGLLAVEVEAAVPAAGGTILVTDTGDIARVQDGVVREKADVDDQSLLWVAHETVGDRTNVAVVRTASFFAMQTVTLARMTPAAGLEVLGTIADAGLAHGGAPGSLEGNRLVVTVRPEGSANIPTDLVLYDVTDFTAPVEIARTTIASIGSIALAGGILDIISSGETASRRQRFDVSGASFVQLSNVSIGAPHTSAPIACGGRFFIVDDNGDLFSVDIDASRFVDRVGGYATLHCVADGTGLLVVRDAALLYDIGDPDAPRLVDAADVPPAGASRAFDYGGAAAGFGSGVLALLHSRSPTHGVTFLSYDLATGIDTLGAWETDFDVRDVHRFADDDSFAAVLGRSVLLGDPGATPAEVPLMRDVGDLIALPGGTGAAWVVHPPQHSADLHDLPSQLELFDHIPASVDETPLAHLEVPFGARLFLIGGVLVALAPDARVVVLDASDPSSPLVLARADLSAASASISSLPDNLVSFHDVLLAPRQQNNSVDSDRFTIDALDLVDPAHPATRNVIASDPFAFFAGIVPARNGDLWLSRADELLHGEDDPRCAGHHCAYFSVQRLSWDDAAGAVVVGPAVSVPGWAIGEAPDGSLLTEDLQYDDNFNIFTTLNRVVLDEEPRATVVQSERVPRGDYRYDGDGLIVRRVPASGAHDVDIFDANTFEVVRTQRWPSGEILRLAPRRALLWRRSFGLISLLSLDTQGISAVTVPESHLLYRFGGLLAHDDGAAFVIAAGARGGYRIPH